MPDRAKESDHAYHIGRLNITFALSSVVLTGCLFVMFQQDYERPWKVYQRQFREMEKDRARMELERMELRKQPGGARKEIEELSRQVQEAQKKLEARQDDIRRLGKEVSSLTGQIYKENNLNLQFRKVEFDVAKYQIEDAVHRGVTPDPKVVLQIQELTQVVAQQAEKVKDLEEKKAGREGELRDLQRDLVELQRAYQAKLSSQADLIRKLGSLGYTVSGDERVGFEVGRGFEDFVYSFRNAPLVDYIDPTIKVRQTVVEDLRDDYYFAQVSKVDRCETCHLAMTRSGYEDAKPPFRSHPGVRAHLYLTSASPHPVEKFGCTVCHGGMSWAVDFNRAFHTPSDPAQEEEWNRWTRVELGVAWSKHLEKEGHYWDHPMLPLKYIESSCLSCHDNPQSIPEAKKLLAGYELFKEFGCFGCHKTPGFENVRKVGPSLMHVSQKLDRDWMLKWVQQPRRSLSHRRMPQVFDLANSTGTGADGSNMTVQNQAEIHAIIAYLFDASGKDSSYQPLSVSGEGDAARGKMLLISKGCFACHENREATQLLKESLARSEDEEKDADAILAEARGTLPGLLQESDFAPSLSGVASKLDKTKGKAWLADWLRDPQHYFPGSTMPSFRLADAEIVDIAAFLLTQRDETMDQHPVPGVEEAVVTQLLVEKKVADQMIQAKAESEVKRLSFQERLIELGRAAVGHYGCSGCHRIPGFEDAQGIGADLSAFGSKRADKLDFGLLHFEHGERNRYAWLEQKLRNPRSFDMEPKALPAGRGHGSSDRSQFQGVRRIPRKDRLRMPQFHFTQEQIESLVTFVTGMKGRPVHPDYRDKLEGERGDRVRGELVLKKYNCSGCHKLEMDSVATAYQDANGSARTGTFRGRFVRRTYNEDDEEKAFYSFQAYEAGEGPGGKVALGDQVTVTRDQIRPDLFRSGWGGGIVPFIVAERVKTLGVPESEAVNYAPPPLHEEGRKVLYPWLYKFLKNPYRIRPATQAVMPTFPMTDEEAHRLVGYFAAQAMEQLRNEAARVLAALDGKELKWLGDREDSARQQIRKLVAGKLPEEGSRALARLVIDRAPLDGVLTPADRNLLKEFEEFTFPFEVIRVTDPDYLAAREAKTSGYLAKGEQLMAKEDPANKNLKGMDCQSCHFIGGVKPGGDKETDFAPDLARVRERLRPHYVHRWLLNPSRIVPGTRMTDFFKDELFDADYAKDAFTYQTIYPGSAPEQASAIRDLLYNWKR
ncbi:MAG: c-type cytochrome [Planctomycetes bacterium]|nr:c-type cytochrome [Planctomycetota bacterium]